MTHSPTEPPLVELTRVNHAHMPSFDDGCRENVLILRRPKLRGPLATSTMAPVGLGRALLGTVHQHFAGLAGCRSPLGHTGGLEHGK
jgi:hypothetical protein